MDHACIARWRWRRAKVRQGACTDFHYAGAERGIGRTIGTERRESPSAADIFTN